MDDFAKPEREPGEDPLVYGRRVANARRAWERTQRESADAPGHAGDQARPSSGNGEAHPAPPGPRGLDDQDSGQGAPPEDVDWADLIGKEGQGKPPAAARVMVRGVAGQVTLMIRTMFQALSWLIPNHLAHLRPLVLLDPLEEQMLGGLVQSYVMGLPSKARAKMVFAFNRFVPPVGLLIVGGQMVLRRWQIIRLVVATSGTPMATRGPAAPAPHPSPPPSAPPPVGDPAAFDTQSAPPSDLMEVIT